MNNLRNLPKSISKIHGDIFPVLAKGSFIYTSDNKKYLDLTSGIGALSSGHCHHNVTKKVSEQLSKYVHLPQQVFMTHPIQVELSKKIVKTMPYKELDTIFYVNSGSEATDNAIKIARKYTGKSNIISMNKGFHGRSIAALSVTSSNLVCKKGTTPLLANTYFCPKPDEQSIDDLLSFQSSPDDTAAIILEPVQGEAGVYSIDAEFLGHVEEICRSNNIMLIVDEVQCGAMRTGSWWNISQKNVRPDILTFGKGIASGYPMAGLVANSDIMNNIGRGGLGGTYGGNAVCSAAASATIDILNDPKIQTNIDILGAYIKKEIEKIPSVIDVRQYGLMIAIEFASPDFTPSIVNKLREKGILVLTAGNNGQYIRLLPPLNISKEEVDIFLEKFSELI